MGERKGSDFAGLGTAIITPFRDGEVDYARLKEQVEFQIDGGTTCIVPCGTTGESPTLSHEEHEKVIAEVIQYVGGRVKVMAGTGSNSTAEALRLTKRAAAEGADATLQVAPYYNKPTQEGFYQHFKAIARSHRYSGLRLQHSRTIRKRNRCCNHRPASRPRRDYDGQRSYRKNGSMLCDHRRDKPDSF